MSKSNLDLILIWVL